MINDNFNTLVDDWVKGNLAALVLKEHLVPVEGKGSPFFPPTFAVEKGDSSYCIDTIKDGTQTCLIDTVGSQANRMEPIFTKDPYDKLIPQITIQAGKEKINLCEVGHRIADALLRNSSIYDEHIKPALVDLQNRNSMTIAKLAPTSLVFGLWDSRGTQIKMPRIVSSVIRAYDVDKLTRSAQYTPPVKYRDEELLGENKDTSEFKKRSKLGFQDAPSTTHGGIIAHGYIQRDVIVNFAALRKIITDDKEKEIVLQKYILGLALVAATSVQEWYLREGCNLVMDPEHKAPEWNLVYSDGRREEIKIEHKNILDFAHNMTKSFGIVENMDVTFDKEKAKEEIKQFKEKSHT